ncbi:MAG: toll/interleukin-1 receptor domain-containing protein [Anaerolineales bacterium]
MGYTFISYSRRQLYFAEAIALHLQKLGIEVWFDLQQLSAGTDWAAALKAGCENCERLVLVVSRAALASPYVQAEWDSALRNGHEVILAVVEDVRIPKKLRCYPIYDFRVAFNRPLKRLAAYLTEKAPAQRDRIRDPGPFPLSLHLSPMIWLSLMAVTLPYLWPLLFSLTGFGNKPVKTGASLVLVSLLLLIAVSSMGTRRFWTHDLSFQGFHYLAGFALVAQLGTLALAIFLNTVSADRLLIGLVVSFLCSLIFYLWIINHSAVLLRWFPAGQVPQKLRRRFHAPLLKKGRVLEEESPPFAPIRFAVHADLADRPLADLVRKALRESGHTEVVEALQADKHIYIVTNRTSRAVIEQAGRKKNQDSIFILGSSVDWCESLAGVGRTQFMDFRENNRRDLKVFAKSLGNLEAWRRQYGLEVTPKKFEAFHAPAGIQFYRYLGYIRIAGAMGMGIGYLVNGLLPGSVFELLVGLVLFIIVNRTLQRRITFPIAVGMLFVFPMLRGLYLAAYTYIIPELAMLWFVWWTGRYWFPAKAPLGRDALGMDACGTVRRGGRIITTAVAVFAGIFSATGQIFISLGFS